LTYTSAILMLTGMQRWMMTLLWVSPTAERCWLQQSVVDLSPWVFLLLSGHPSSWVVWLDELHQLPPWERQHIRY
jgi:hypothetical protein